MKFSVYPVDTPRNPKRGNTRLVVVNRWRSVLALVAIFYSNDQYSFSIGGSSLPGGITFNDPSIKSIRDPLSANDSGDGVVGVFPVRGERIRRLTGLPD
jgi:hypothetical protein